MERLGVSVRNVLEARKAQSDGADYLGVGAMFSTRTKPDASVVSIEELLKIRQAVSVPIVVIGGIDWENAAIFVELGIDGLAVASAILSRQNVREEAESFMKIVRKG